MVGSQLHASTPIPLAGPMLRDPTIRTLHLWAYLTLLSQNSIRFGPLQLHRRARVSQLHRRVKISYDDE